MRFVFGVDLRPLPRFGGFQRANEMRGFDFVPLRAYIGGVALHRIRRLPARPGHRLPDGVKHLKHEREGVHQINSVGHGRPLERNREVFNHESHE